MNYCGVDLAGKSSAICIADKEGDDFAECEVATDEECFGKLFEKLAPTRCLLEASPLAEWAARTIEAHGHEAVIIDPRKAKAVVQTKKKTDKLDARNLALMARSGWYSAVHRKSPEARLSRTLLGSRRGLVKTALAMSSRIRGLLRAHGIKLGAVSESEFVGRVREVAQGRCKQLWPMLRPLCAVYLLARKEAEALRKGIKKATGRDELCRRLMTVPGIGPLTAQAFVATIDDPSRFEDGEKVASYLGLVPSVHQSGETEYRGRITKDGDDLLRWLLVEAAHVLLTRTKKWCRLKAWGVRLSRKKGHGKARVAVARKLAMLLHQLWISGKEFNWSQA